MTNETNKQKMHPYSQVLQWVAEGKEIEINIGTYNGSTEWSKTSSSEVFYAAEHGINNNKIFQPRHFRLKPERHVHQDLIDAFEKGAKVQYWSKSAEEWINTLLPVFCETNKYRIKPEPKPDVVRYIHITKERSVDIATYFPSAWVGAVLEVTLDGETGEIKHSKKYQGDFND